MLDLTLILYMTHNSKLYGIECNIDELKSSIPCSFISLYIEPGHADIKVSSCLLNLIIIFISISEFSNLINFYLI